MDTNEPTPSDKLSPKQYGELVKVGHSIHEEVLDATSGHLMAGTTSRLSTRGLVAFGHKELEAIFPTEYTAMMLHFLNEVGMYIVNSNALIEVGETLLSPFSPPGIQIEYKATESPDNPELLRLQVNRIAVTAECHVCGEHDSHTH